MQGQGGSHVLDGTTLMSYGLEFAPAVIAVLAAALAVWIVWRLVRRVLRFAFRGSGDAPVRTRHSPDQERREPVLGAPGTPAAPSVPDAADILALKASIDALTRQIASLERKLVLALEGSRSEATSLLTGARARYQPRPTNGIFVAMTVMVRTLAVSGRPAM
jgi:hypothetical protein